MTIRGLHADEALQRFHPNQHINVWDVLMRSFYCEAQMKSLPEEVLEDPESYFLEPVKEDGTPLSLQEALHIHTEIRASLLCCLWCRKEYGREASVERGTPVPDDFCRPECEREHRTKKGPFAQAFES